jgi:hypothetical protein
MNNFMLSVLISLSFQLYAKQGVVTHENKQYHIYGKHAGKVFAGREEVGSFSILEMLKQHREARHPKAIKAAAAQETVRGTRGTRHRQLNNAYVGTRGTKLRIASYNLRRV